MFEAEKIIILYLEDAFEWYKPVQVFFNNIVIRVSFFQEDISYHLKCLYLLRAAYSTRGL